MYNYLINRNDISKSYDSNASTKEKKNNERFKKKKINLRQNLIS